MPKPDLQKFLNDPEFQKDRELMTGFLDDYFTKKKEEADKKKKENPGDAPSIFDTLFGGK
jgi:hypothetical protein